jgi:hypothetical protein
MTARTWRQGEGGKEAMQVKWRQGFCRFRPLIVGFHSWTGQCRLLPKAFETAYGPLAQRGGGGQILMENTSFGGFGTGPHCLDSGRLVDMFTRHEPLDSSFWCVLQTKFRATSHANLATLHHHGMREASGGIHLQDLPLIPLSPRSHHG